MKYKTGKNTVFSGAIWFIRPKKQTCLGKRKPGEKTLGKKAKKVPFKNAKP
jgi:hypothetical protein